MRILVLTQWYPPEPWGIYAELAEELARLGHDVTVLTGFPNYPSGNVYPGYRMRVGFKERIRGIEVVRVPLYSEHSSSGARRALNFLSFALSAGFLAPALIRRPDVIYVVQPPTACLAAWFLAKLWNVPFVYEIQDMWPETLEVTGMMSSPVLLELAGRFCAGIHERAAAIRVISPGFRRNLLGKGVPGHKISMIPNWVDPEKYHPEEPDPAMAEQLGTAGKFNVVYAGNVGLAQGLDVVVESAELLRHSPEVRFVVVGDGVDLPRLQEMSRRHGLSNICFVGRLPSNEMNRVYSVADVLLIHLKDDPLFRITIPHKTLTYLAVGKPVLAAVEGDVSEVVEAAGAGLACPSGNSEALAARVLTLSRMPQAERDEMGRNGRRVAVDVYSQRAQVARVAELLKSVA